MYGIEVAVILLAVVISIVLIWTSPQWMNALARGATRLSRRIDRAGVAIEKTLGIDSEASTYVVDSKRKADVDDIPMEER